MRRLLLTNNDKRFNTNELDDLLKKQKYLVNKIGEINFEESDLAAEKAILSEILVDIKDYIRKIILCEATFNKFINKIEIGHLEKAVVGKRQKIIIHYAF